MRGRSSCGGCSCIRTWSSCCSRGFPPPTILEQRIHPNRDTMSGMHVAQVKNGRLTLDEPTDLPEGTKVPLEIADDWDDLDDEERAALHESIREGIEDMEAGRTVNARAAIAGLRSRL